MFKSIEFIKYDANSELYVDKLTDSEFVCEISALKFLPAVEHRWTNVIISEYKKRNLLILPNLFLYNIYLCKKYDLVFIKLLESQNKYCKEMRFDTDYYYKLKEIYEKHKSFI